MSNKLTKIALAASLLGMPILAGANDNSLFAIEGGYSNIKAERITNNVSTTIQKNEFASGGVKIGAESEKYRMFLSARYYDAKDFNKLNTLGAEFQYKFNFSHYANFFLGGNIGKAYMKVSDGVNPSVDSSSMYMGGDAGLNIHAGERLDLEIGARYMNINDTVNVSPTVSYKFTSLVTAYASIIFKWKTD